MTLSIPQEMLARIHVELAKLPAVIGKVSLHLEFNCGTSKTIGSLKIKKSVEEEVRS